MLNFLCGLSRDGWKTKVLFLISEKQGNSVEQYLSAWSTSDWSQGFWPCSRLLRGSLTHWTAVITWSALSSHFAFQSSDVSLGPKWLETAAEHMLWTRREERALWITSSQPPHTNTTLTCCLQKLILILQNKPGTELMWIIWKPPHVSDDQFVYSHKHMSIQAVFFVSLSSSYSLPCPVLSLRLCWTIGRPGNLADLCPPLVPGSIVKRPPNPQHLLCSSPSCVNNVLGFASCVFV